MNVAYVLSSLSRSNGGVSESVRRLAQNVGQLDGVRASAFGLEDEHTSEDLPLWAPVPTRAFPIRGPRALGFAPGLDRALEADAVDVLHTAGLWMYPSIAARKWKRKTSRPYIVSPHGMLDPWALRNSGWKKKIAERAYERAHLEGAACLHALCESEASSLRAFGLRNPICVLPNGVDLPDVSRPPAPAPWSARFSTDLPVMLFLGRLHPKKGLTPLLRAWATIRDSGWRLAIAGWDQGGHRAELEKLARELRVDEQILFLGPLHGAQKEAAYRSASAFILPSFSEGLPMAILEAWAYGVPVLMTEACNLPEGFAADAAWLVHTEERELARELQSFFSMSVEDRRAMGQRARDLAAGTFEWPRIATEMAAVYRWAIGSGEKPACIREGA
ncbi:MAG: glycosyltransferase [Kiritimatiellae bacterium]|nr:glycosyltransferase [Kiritimatiellia bacterium]